MTTHSLDTRLAPCRALPGINTFEAATAVFDTNELLHLIVSAVPCEHRTSLRRVSKAWEAAVSKIGYTIRPIGYRVMSNFLRPWMPLCTPSITLKINRVFFSYSSFVSAGDPKTFNILMSTQQDDVIMFELRHEFITDPPITQLAICSSQNPHVASLHVRGGIRVGDLRECLLKINSTPFVFDTWAAYSRPNEA
jgi:hypothetical protein